MKNSDEKLLDDFIRIRNLSDRTKHGYKDALKIYTKFNNKSFDYLLKEANIEEDNRIRWKDRKLKKRLIDFRLYLTDNYLFSTSKTHFQRVLTFYKHFDIEIHSLPPISTKNCKQSPPISFEDLPTKETIHEAIEISNPVMRALILFMATSGCARRETLNLTIQDFIEATSSYHNDKKDIKKALITLSDLDDVIPTFRIRRQKTNKFYFTFCSPMASNEIIDYLLNNRKLESNNQLFKINLDYLSNNFTKINNELKLGKIGKYNRFRSHMLRKFHASSLYNSDIGFSLDEIDALQGRSKNKTHSSYFMENPQVLKEKYSKIADKLI